MRRNSEITEMYFTDVLCFNVANPGYRRVLLNRRRFKVSAVMILVSNG